MQLTSIKLSGFKSFVDPTTIRVNGKRIGIVGPNGCGKSNIIDAVRWVLGESRASELRGESMKDVIFNGTVQRKPAGRASVELVFDNPDGKIGGQWGKYGELAVKRVLTREGGSTYFINNVVVRRRDVQDIFLGTGLGPRAYAIIGQGMIARIIEARPEELRTFLEEAAGVSKYRERRRETENRLADTHDNLNRVADILHELEHRLENLRTQAELAEQYQSRVKARERQQQLLWLLQKETGMRECAELTQAVQKSQTDLDAATADLFHCEASLTKWRETHEQVNRQVHAAQGSLYQTNAEIGSLEAQLRYVAETKKRLQTQIRACQDQKEEWTVQIATLTEELSAEKASLEEIYEQGEIVRAVHEHQLDTLPHAEERLEAVREKARAIHDHLLHIRQQIAVSSNNHKNLSDALSDCRTRQERRVLHKRHLPKPEAEKRVLLKDERAELVQKLEELRFTEEAKRESLFELEETYRVLQEQLNRCRAAGVSGEARLDALKQLQEKTQTKEKLQEWLEKHDLSGFPPLWPSIQVDAGWETALEVVLKERLQSLELTALKWTQAFVKDSPPAKICFFADRHDDLRKTGEDRTGLTRLSDRVDCQRPSVRAVLKNWLCHIYVAADLQEALEKRERLPEGAVFVVPEGHTIDRYSVRFFAADSEKEGFFSRQREIGRLERIQGELKTEQLELLDHFQGSKRALKEAEAHLQQMQRQAADLTQQVHDLELTILKSEEAERHYRDQLVQMEKDMAELEALAREKQTALEEEEKRLEELDSLLAEWQQQEEDIRKEVLEKEEELKGFQEQVRQSERQMQQVAFEKASLGKRLIELESRLEAAHRQLSTAGEKLIQGQLELQGLDDEVVQEGLQTLLEKRLVQEEALTGLRQELDGLDEQLRTEMERRLRLEKSLQPRRDNVVALQLKEQAARLHVEQYEQKLHEAKADVAELMKAILPGAKSSVFQKEIDRLSSEIESMGPVNLGAAMELKEGETRKRYLDEQHRDLTEAIATLEDAIKRIDRETRLLLKTTFDRVNQSLGELFPALFGGGHAELLMEGGEILEAGVQIMAQPPGKKNATIHLLSGGEKALTAIALIFSLFQLNPAPFCLLDEVDAPLDDANTERFGKMVAEMSGQTQFLFISHNRIAMEMAEELIGVTMQEQGVSRIVTVDIDDAATFSEEVLKA